MLGGIHLAGSLITVDDGAFLFRGGRVVHSNFDMCVGTEVGSLVLVSVSAVAIRCIHHFECRPRISLRVHH